jgi:transketolase
MKQPVIYILTHDSVAVGEDGPTHQPVEHLASLRAIPGLTVIRPADAVETAAAWRTAIRTTDAPVALVFSRQKLPILDRSDAAISGGVEQGAYVIADSKGRPEIILIASGSEVQIAMAVRAMLAERGIAARVVSMPSWELFEKESPEYKQSVLPQGAVVRMAIEAGISMGWERYVGSPAAVVAVDAFGASAPGGTVLNHFGFTAENVLGLALDLLGR